MEKDFLLFQEEFKKWQKRFGLNGYRIYFKCEPIEDNFAGIIVTAGDMIATAWLNSKPARKGEPRGDAKQDAKHEAIHLLIGRLACLARSRYCSEAEIYEAAEELAVRLEGLIPD